MGEEQPYQTRNGQELRNVSVTSWSPTLCPMLRQEACRDFRLAGTYKQVTLSDFRLAVASALNT